MKKLTMLVVLFAIVTSAFAAVNIGEKGVRDFNAIVSVRPGMSYNLEADSDANEAAASFNVGLSWLYMYGNVSQKISYELLLAMENGNVFTPLANAKFQIVDMLSIKAGKLKAPLGRMYNTSSFRLMFKNRNPLFYEYSPKARLGIAPKFTLMENKYNFELGIFNSFGSTGTLDNTPTISGSFMIQPLGAVPMHESAHMGFDEMKVAVVPGFVMDKTTEIDGSETSETTFGGHVAFRMMTLAFDALYYTKITGTDTDGIDDITDSGLSVQAAYAINKIEPIARFTMFDPNTDEDDGEETTIEVGCNYYLDGYNSRFGLNFTNKSIKGDDDYKFNTIDVIYTMFF